jgi:hypothetical protein
MPKQEERFVALAFALAMMIHTIAFWSHILVVVNCANVPIRSRGKLSAVFQRRINLVQFYLYCCLSELSYLLLPGSKKECDSTFGTSRTFFKFNQVYRK